jgi:hypothetical protein
MSGARPVRSLCQPLKTKAEALLQQFVATWPVISHDWCVIRRSHISLHMAHLACRRGLRIPFDLRILRILLPAPGSQCKLSSTHPPLVLIASNLTSDNLDLSDTMAISQDDTNL